MPQMSPMWWEVLYVYFIIMFMMTNIIMYFNIKVTMINKINKITISSMNWKW